MAKTYNGPGYPCMCDRALHLGSDGELAHSAAILLARVATPLLPCVPLRAGMRTEEGKDSIPYAVRGLGFEMYVPILGGRYTLL